MKEGIHWLPRIVVGLVGSIIIVIIGMSSSIAEAYNSSFTEVFRTYIVPTGYDKPNISEHVNSDMVVRGETSTFSRPSPPTTTIPPVPYLIDQMYGFHERGDHIVALQEFLGMEQVDGIYGKNTRSKHMLWFGTIEDALKHFNGRNQWYLESIEENPADEYLGQYWVERPTLEQLVNQWFLPNDRALALRIAFCESSALPHHTHNDAVSSALAVGAFQHLSRYWKDRSAAAGFKGWDIYDLKAQVGVAAHLFYSSGVHHWNPSKKCWKDTL